MQVEPATDATSKQLEGASERQPGLSNNVPDLSGMYLNWELLGEQGPSKRTKSTGSPKKIPFHLLVYLL